MTTPANEGTRLDMPAPGAQATMAQSTLDGTDQDWREADNAIVFQDGLPGFPEACRFELTMLDTNIPLLMSLRSTDDAGLSFVVIAFTRIERIYRDADIRVIESALGADIAECALLGMVTLTAGARGVEAHANLRAPIAINVNRRRGFQIVLPDQKLPFRSSIGCVADADFPKSPCS